MYKSQYIGGQKEKFVRLDDLDSTLSMSSDPGAMKRCGFSIEGLTHTVRPKHNPTKSFRVGVKKGSEGLLTFGRSLRSNVSRAVFSEDLHISEKTIFDPQDKQLLFWNKLLILLSLLSVSIDPLFFYLPVFDPQKECLTLDGGLSVTTIFLRTVMDVLFVFRILLQFRTAYIAPSSRVFGRGELVIDPTQIAKRYLQRYFVVDFLSVLPLPQIVVFRHLYLSNADASTTKHALVHLVVLQAIPRFIRIYPIFSELKKSAGTLTEGAWTGAAFYLLSYILFSHILGALWYFFSVERKYECWEKACSTNEDCQKKYLFCHSEQVYEVWERIKNDTVSQCSTDNDKPTFNYGIYTQAISSQIVESTHFFSKLCYCLWWGLQNLSTLGQGLETSTYYKEVLFSIALAISGLILFALLIGNMQTYLQSLTVRLEEMRVKRRDSEQWMHHRLLPQELRERVRRYDQYKWLETRGVDEESIVRSLPKDLRRDIKRHLCLNLVRRVPLFANMDERLLDAICERLKPSLYTEHTYIIREGDPVEDMLFIIRGRLESITTDGGRSGFFNRGILKEADFCGEELLTWALDPKAGSNLPSSTRTVMALTEVEAFALEAEELKFVASQFRRLHSRQIQHTFRFYSQQWRTWAAVFIQAAWRRYSKRKRAEQYRKEEEEEEEDEYDSSDDEDDDQKALVSRSDSFGSTSMGATILASRFAANAIRGHKLRQTDSTSPVKLQKPSEPDFSKFTI